MDRAHRVRRRSDFDRVRRQGRRLAHPLLRLQLAPNELAVTRFGFVVSKRVAPLAHDRNRLRRRLRELARAEIAALPGGYDLILSAQPAARDADFVALGAALRQLLRRARLAEPPASAAPLLDRPSP